MIRYAFRLACANLKRTQNVTLPFFIASTVTVFLHFLIMTMMFNPHVPEIRGGATLAFIFQLGVFVITTFAILFMISIHQMLLKKRKKELGLYTILGMEKKHISLILCWENWIQTLASLGLGLLLGLVCGRLIWMILLRILNSPNGLPYAFSWTALGWTAAVFIGLFLATTAVSLFQIHRLNPIELLHSEKQADKPVRLLAVKTVFGLICLAAGVDFLASTASNLVAAIRRKRRVLGIIRLMGFSGADIVCFPLMQTLFTSALGMGLAFALYAAVAGVINALFPLGAELGAVCRLSWAHVGGAAGVVLALSLLAALPPSLSCSRLSPSEVIRNE